MGCTQTGVLKPAHYVLSSHMFQSLSQGVVETRSRSRRSSTEELLALRPQLLNWGIVRTVGRQRQHLGPSLLDRCRHAGCQVGAEVVKHDDIACVQLRHHHRLHVRLERCCVVAPGNASGARTPSRPNAAMTVSVPQEVGTGPIARSPRGAQAWVAVIAVLTPVSSTKTSRFGSICFTFLRNRRRFFWTSGRLRSAACRVFFL